MIVNRSSFVRSFVHSFLRSCVRACVRSLVHSFMHGMQTVLHRVTSTYNGHLNGHSAVNAAAVIERIDYMMFDMISLLLFVILSPEGTNTAKEIKKRKNGTLKI